MRKPAAKVKPRLAKSVNFPAPVGGWIKNQNLVTPGARLPDGSRVNGAYVLENWFPTATGNRMRRGSDLYATIGDGTLDVASMFCYLNGNNQKLFAATAAAIYDITTPALLIDSLLVDDLGNLLVDDLGDFLLSGSAAGVPGLSGGAWSVLQFATPGGVFLRAVNGVDTPLVYDGANFSTSPAITGTGLTPSVLSQVWAYKQRVFFVQSGTLDAWYLPVDSIGGVAVKLPLGGVFRRGGALLFGASWSLDSGGGLAEQCVFVTTEGEVAVYQGTDPSTAATWSRVGVYRIGRPPGPKAFIHAGGDIVIATDIGFVPLSQAVQRDFAALSPSAVSYQIETAWNDAVKSRSGSNWSCEVWPTSQMVLIALPTPSGGPAQMLVANARTGAWALFTGWNGTCLQLFGARMFFGSAGGKIIEAEITGADQGAPYTAVCVPLFDPLKAPASLKTSLLMRAMVRAPAEVIPGLSLQADFVVNLPAPPDGIAASGLDLWGTGIWGTAKWGTDVALKVFERWQSVGGSGYAIAPGVQITSGNIAAPNVELVQVDVTYDIGDIAS